MKNKSQKGSILSTIITKVTVVCTAVIGSIIALFNPNYSNISNTEKVVEEKSFISQVSNLNYGDYVDLGTKIIDEEIKLNDEENLRFRLENL